MQNSPGPVVRGVVQRGRRLGRRLGFPTANVPAPPSCRAAFGVYATRTRLADGRIYDGVASLGVNPTVGGTPPVLEVWLFEFDEEIYDQVIEVELVAYLREERRFEDLDTLAAQVRRDAAAARRALADLATAD